MSGRREIAVVARMPDLVDLATGVIERALLDRIEVGRTTLALAGGATPAPVYRHLASRPLPWARLEIFFGDERCVPPDDPASNYGMAHRALLARVPLRDEHVHRIPGELAPEAAARAAAAPIAELPGDPPRLDVIVLGVGPDGHCASLFPGGPELDVAGALTVAVHRPELPQPWRVSLTMPVLNAAHHVVVLVSGAEKAAAVGRALAGDERLPAGRLAPERISWILTEDAASEIPED